MTPDFRDETATEQNTNEDGSPKFDAGVSPARPEFDPDESTQGLQADPLDDRDQLGEG